MKHFEAPNMTMTAFEVEDILSTSYSQSGGISGSASDSDDSEFGS